MSVGSKMMFSLLGAPPPRSALKGTYISVLQNAPEPDVP